MSLQRPLHPISSRDSREQFRALLCPSAGALRAPAIFLFFLGVLAILARDISSV
jgi:hypothetical protein